jgi:hypothetical protein
MNIKDAMVAGLATKRIQRIEPMRIATLNVQEFSGEHTEYNPDIIRQMNLNINVRFSDKNGEGQAKDQLMKAIFGDVVDKLHGLEYSLRNDLIEESIELIRELRNELQ